MPPWMLPFESRRAAVLTATRTFYLEPVDANDLPRRFLEAFAAILAHSNYAMVLDAACRLANHCGRCAETCPAYQSSGEVRDIPCQRSKLLLRIYRRYFTARGAAKARLAAPCELTEEGINELAEEFYRCTACRRCKIECPLGIDHGLITHLARWVLAEVGIVPKALRVATREQLDGKTRNTSAIPAAAMIDTCQFLEEDCRDTYGFDVHFPIDQEGAE